MARARASSRGCCEIVSSRGMPLDHTCETSLQTYRPRRPIPRPPRVTAARNTSAKRSGSAVRNGVRCWRAAVPEPVKPAKRSAIARASATASRGARGSRSRERRRRRSHVGPRHPWRSPARRTRAPRRRRGRRARARSTGRTKTSRSAKTSGRSSGGRASARRRMRAGAALEFVEEPSLPATAPPATTRCRRGSRRLRELERVEQHVEALPRVDASGRTGERDVVGDAEPRRGTARRGRLVLVGVRGLADDDDVVGVELRGDRVRHADHRRREVAREEALDVQCGARLDDDLTRVPHVRPARDGRDRPTRTTSAASSCGRRRSRKRRTSRARRATASGQPTAYAIHSRTPVRPGDPCHRHDVHRHSRGFELGAQRRLGRHHDVALELVGWQAAQHPEKGLIRPAALRDGLDGQ